MLVKKHAKALKGNLDAAILAVPEREKDIYRKWLLKYGE